MALVSYRCPDALCCFMSVHSDDCWKSFLLLACILSSIHTEAMSFTCIISDVPLGNQLQYFNVKYCALVKNVECTPDGLTPTTRAYSASRTSVYRPHHGTTLDRCLHLRESRTHAKNLFFSWGQKIGQTWTELLSWLDNNCRSSFDAVVSHTYLFYTNFLIVSIVVPVTP